MGKGGNAGAAGGRKVTAAELAKHDDPSKGAWLAISGKVYDVTNWEAHPGGRVLYSVAGTDATDVFRAFHSPGAYDVLSSLPGARLVGDLEGKAAVLSPFEKEYRDLISAFKAEGLFRASPLYYVFKFLSTTAIAAGAAHTTLAYEGVEYKVGGALLTALFWQQCGWLAHDFAHHQVFGDRRFNDAAVLVIGNLYQGFSLDWWKSKHNTHHAIPNLHEKEEGAHDGDPDIDTLPFLAWSVRLARKVQPASGAPESTGMARWLVARQAFLYFPILLFARLTWSWQSLTYAFSMSGVAWNAESKVGGSDGLRYPLMEKLLIAMHYAWVGALAYFGCGQSALWAALWFVLAETSGGILLAIPFGVGHNGMTVYDADKKPGFAELQITTTRNIDGGFLTGWFMGGLHLQVEHHLFPTIPRHNLSLTRPRVEALCKKHNVPYHATTLWEGTKEVISHLAEVTASLKDFPAA